MINFLDILHKPQDTLNIVDGVVIKEGDIVNVYGEPFVGKTLFCYWLINNNSDKAVVYFDTEATPYPFLGVMGKHVNIIYTNQNDAEEILKLMQRLVNDVDYFIIDSLTATVIEENANVLLRIFNLVKRNKKNLILVSQVREWNGEVFYDYKRLLNFFCYKAKIEEKGGESVVNGGFTIKKDFLKFHKEEKVNGKSNS